MAYTHLTMNELGWIETYYEIGYKPYKIAKKLGRSNQPIYNVVNFLKEGGTVRDYFKRYEQNKTKCGAKKKTFTSEQIQYVKNRVADGWTPDVIIGRGEKDLGCSMRTLYRRFKDSALFDVTTLPMQGKRKPNGHKETRGKQGDKRTLDDRKKAYPTYENEFGHLEGDTIIGKNHKSAVITFAERVSKLIIALETPGRKAEDIEWTLNNWFKQIPNNLFKSITFDCGKEFSNWKNLSNQQDISIFFADPGCPSQRGLNEHSNGLLRKDGLPKQMDFNEVNQAFISSVAVKRNKIPRKSLNYKTPLEVFLENVSGLDYF
ncbi:IS30 family transposase [Marinilactibacillus psychrotolerans]|uniref:IS30 family transposase n=1 Tax=Marinilactibacillus psychrotolerans TaxID=191770 RepID=UPI00388A7364